MAPLGLGHLGRGTKLSETQPFCSHTNFTRRGPLENSHSSYPSSKPLLPPQHPLTMQWSIRNQVLLLELHPLSDSFPSPPTILLFQTTEGPSPAGVSKSLQSVQEKLSPSKDVLLRISTGSMALRRREGNVLVKYLLCVSLCLEDHRPLPLTLEPGIPIYLVLSRGSWL